MAGVATTASGRAGVAVTDAALTLAAAAAAAAAAADDDDDADDTGVVKGTAPSSAATSLDAKPASAFFVSEDKTETGYWTFKDTLSW